MCSCYISRNPLDPEEEKKGVLCLQASRTGKESIMTELSKVVVLTRSQWHVLLNFFMLTMHSVA